MYLVFIAMMAMNMSKEVLAAFGLIDIKFTESNELTSQSNQALLADLIQKGEEKPQEFGFASQNAKKISRISEDFYKYIASLKADLLREGKFKIDPETGKLPFQEMDKTDLFDKWFTGDRLSKPGAAVMAKIEKYKSDIKEVLGDDVKYQKALETFENRFNTEKVKNKDGKLQDYLDYHYKGYPAIASYTKLTAMQNDVKVTEASMYNLFLGNTLTEAVTLKNYQAIVLADKNAFFTGEKFQGKVVLGKYANVIPTKLQVQGQDINIEESINENGAVSLDFNTGYKVGDQEIKGKFTFLEDGKELEIPILGNYVVVPKPNEASVAADKMNVVYQGLDNPLTVSVPGVSNKDVVVSAPGITKIGDGKYNLKPTKGREVIVKVRAELEGGEQIYDEKKFRIKELPRAVAKVRGKIQGSLNKNDLSNSKVTVGFENFAYELNLGVSQFTVNVEGQPPVINKGSTMKAEAKNAINSAKRGSTVTISNIRILRPKGYLNLNLKDPNPIVISLKN